MTSALRRLTGGNSQNFPASVVGKEEAGLTTDVMYCSDPLFGTPSDSPSSDLDCPVLVQNLFASQDDAERRGTPGFERGRGYLCRRGGT